MAGNPQVQQGTLNRLRASIVVPNYPALNITSSYLGRAGISITFEGETTTMINTMTGVVTSPMPYQMITVSASLLKTQSLSAAWEAQRQLVSVVGDINVIPDTTTLPTYVFNNCAIGNVRELNFAGEDASYSLTLIGYYQINSVLWSFS